MQWQAIRNNGMEVQTDTHHTLYTQVFDSPENALYSFDFE